VGTQAETFKAVEHIYKLTDTDGAVANAEIRFTGFQTLVETTNASGLVNPFILVVERTNVAGTIGFLTPPIPTVGTTSYTRSIKSYRHQAEVETMTIDTPLGSAAQPFAFGMTVDPGVTETNTATVSGYAGITNAASSYVLSGTLTLNQVYDSRKLYWRNNLGVPAPAKVGDRVVFGASITIAAPASNPAATTKFTEVETTGSLTLSASGNYSTTKWIRGSGTVTTVATGSTNLAGWEFTGATVDNASASAAIVLVDYDQIANITTTSTGGGSISVRSAPVVFTGFPTAANANGRSADATFGIQDVSSEVWHTYDASSGSVSVSLSELATAPDYQLIVRGDAIGWIRTPDSTIDADYSGTFNFANLFREIVDEDGDAMVGLGTQSVMDKITYNQGSGRFEIDSGAIDFFSALDKKRC
jgi:hypothetical protein